LRKVIQKLGWVLFSFVMVLLAIVGWSVHLQQQSPTVTIRVESEEINGDRKVICFTAKNEGSRPLVAYGYPPMCQVRYYEGRDLKSEYPKSLSGRSSFSYLEAGRIQTNRVEIPAQVMRYKAGCFFETGGLRSAVAARLLSSGWWNRAGVAKYLLRILPDGRAEEVEFWSDDIESKTGKEI
jgi:hypothetical protein